MDESLKARVEDCIELATPEGARVWATAQGAHVLDWVPAAGMPGQLFVSQASAFGAGASIRGGVPVIFPQFGQFGELPKHGFARRSRWQLADRQADSLRYELRDSEDSRAIWPHAFVAGLTVQLQARRLQVSLDVTNTGSSECQFTAGLHSYLRVDEIADAALQGLGGRAYWDATADLAHREQPAGDLRFAGELDRVYPQVTGPLTVTEGERSIEITARGFEDVVVWNPGPIKAADMTDMEPHGDRRMLCVEAAQIAKPVSLAAGESWRGSQTLKI